MTEPEPMSSLVRRAHELVERAGEVDVDEDAFPEEAARTVELMRASRWSARIPQRFVSAQIDDFDDDVRPTLERWARQPEGRNLLLLGPVGTGKSRAAVAACRHAHDHGLVVAFWPIVELLAALRPGDDQISTDNVVDVDRLVLDDLGSERLTEWAVEQLFIIVNRRWLDESPTIFTSNLKPDDLAVELGERMFSRIGDRAMVLWISGEDRRRQTS